MYPSIAPMDPIGGRGNIHQWMIINIINIHDHIHQPHSSVCHFAFACMSLWFVPLVHPSSHNHGSGNDPIVKETNLGGTHFQLP